MLNFMVHAKTRKWLILLCVGIGTFLSSINSSLTNTILPVIERDLKISLGQSEWVVLIFLLILTVLLIPTGRISDIIGHRRIFLIGFAVFICAGVVCGCSGNFLCLLIGRALLAVGGAMILSVGPAIITATFSRDERGKALGLQALMTYVGLSLGPLAGGSITQLLGWEFAFFITIPFGVVGLLLGVFVIPEETVKNIKELDMRGMIYFAVAMVAGTLFLNSSSIEGLNKFILLLMLLMAFALWKFYHTERKATSPMIQLSLFRIRNFGFGAVGAAFNYLCFYIVLFSVPFYFDRVLHASSMQTGLLLTIMPIIMTICSPIVGSLSDRFGSRIFSMTGMLFSALGLALFGFMARISGLAAFCLLISGLICAGLGTGIFAAPNNSAIMGAAPQEYQGVAAGVLATFRIIGMIAGTTIGGSLLDIIISYLGLKGFASQNAFALSFSTVMWAGTLFGIIGFFCSFFMNKNKTSTN